LPDARPAGLSQGTYWTELALEAERGLLDFVTFEDAPSLQPSSPARPDRRLGEVRGRLDAVLIVARVAPVAEHIGSVPAVTVTHTPSRSSVSKSIATLDYVSGARAGWRAQVSDRAHEARHFGRRDLPEYDRPDVGSAASTDPWDELVGAAQETANRSQELVHVFGELLVFLDVDEGSARARRTSSTSSPKGR
jgi:alkanesulfonate monooxygenase SsuD/methylene tetrahydromethanopterin reductase-like flavin-dependent oxidoreductase (luciferase family)